MDKGKAPDNSHSSLKQKGNVAEKPSLAERVTTSANQLAASVASSSTRGAIVSGNRTMGGDAKSLGRQDNSALASQEWMAEKGSNKSNYNNKDMNAGQSTSAVAFRRQMRSASLQDGIPTGTSNVAGSSHQVALAQNLDGRGVVDFLAKDTPTPMYTSLPSAVPSIKKNNYLRQDTSTAIDPVTYLKGSTYSIDMEGFDDHQILPNINIQSSSSSSTSGSPASRTNKAWSEHGASVLEEWQLNEAWDRAWMDTAWSVATKKDKDDNDEDKTEPVLPNNKNLSYLLKPRI